MHVKLIPVLLPAQHEAFHLGVLTREPQGTGAGPDLALWSGALVREAGRAALGLAGGRHVAGELCDLADPGREGRQRGEPVEQHGRGGRQRPGAAAQADADPARRQVHAEPLGQEPDGEDVHAGHAADGSGLRASAGAQLRAHARVAAGPLHLLARVLAVGRGCPGLPCSRCRGSRPTSAPKCHSAGPVA